MSSRRYPEGIRAALHVLSGGGCYRPDCGEPAIRFVDRVPEINLEIAHIHALEDDGPRAIRTMLESERNAFPNLIWLCEACHKRVDSDERAYPAILLKKWKHDREAQPLERLAGLRDLDIAGMEKLLHRAMEEIRRDMEAFTSTFPDLASVLQETIEGLPSLDPESLEMLSDAADLLGLPDFAPMMHSAATGLELPDWAPMLMQAGQDLELPDYAPMLSKAAHELDLKNQVPLLLDVARSLRKTAETMSTTARSMEVATDPDQLNPNGEVEIRYLPRRTWKAIAVGMLGWAVTGLFIYLHIKGHF